MAKTKEKKTAVKKKTVVKKEKVTKEKPTKPKLLRKSVARAVRKSARAIKPAPKVRPKKRKSQSLLLLNQSNPPG